MMKQTKAEEASRQDEQHNAPSKKRRFIFGALWLILWPIIVLFPAMGAFIGGLIVAQFILGGEQGLSKNWIYGLQTAIFVGTVLLVVVCQLLKRFLNNRRRYFFRTGGSVLGFYVWVGIIVSGLVMINVSYQPGVVKPPTEQNAKLMGAITAIGGDRTKLVNVSVLYVNDYKNGFEDQAGEYAPYYDQNGDFSYGVITIKRGLDPEAEKVVVAHEYLHHIWETQIDPQALYELTSQLITMYGKDAELQNRVAIYSDTNKLQPTELFSFYCTELSDQYLSAYVLEQCNTYIDRSVLKFAR